MNMSASEKAMAVNQVRDIMDGVQNVDLEYFLEDEKNVEKLVRGVEVASFNHRISFTEALLGLGQQTSCALISIGEACRGCMYRFPDVVV